MFKPEPLPHDAVVKAGEYCLEQDNNLVSGANPRGIGDYFGSATQDNLNSKQTSVLWCDNELQPVSTTNVCRCIEPGKAYATKDPDTARHMRVTAVEYTKEGVEVWVEYEKKTKKNQKKLKKTPVTTTTPSKRKRNVVATRTAKAQGTSKAKGVATRTAKAQGTSKAKAPLRTSPRKRKKVVATRTAKAKPKPKQKATSKAKAKTTNPKKKATSKAKAKSSTTSPKKKATSKAKAKSSTTSPKKKETAKGNSNPSTTSPKKKATAKVDARWLRCRKKSLSTDQETKLNDCFGKATDDMTWLGDHFSLPMYYAVVDRLAREYISVWKQHGDKMHLNREQILRSVIPKVLRQIRPVVTIPTDDVDIMEAVQPLLETTFNMPGPPSLLKVLPIGYSCS